MANIKVSIAENDLKTLKTNKYNLCLAFGERSMGIQDKLRASSDWLSAWDNHCPIWMLPI